MEARAEKIGRRPTGRKLKLILLVCVVFFSVLDIKLAGSHMAHTFHLFRKAHQIIPVFLFGFTCWAFILALPLALVPFKKLSYKHRYMCSSLFLILLMDLAYLLSFVFMSLRH